MATKHFLGGRIILGTEYAGYKYRIFDAGTSTPKTTYKDSALTVGNENSDPIVLDANGACQIWFDGNAKSVFYDPNDVVIYTDDNVNVTTSSTATGESNLVRNPSFEDDTDADSIPDDWTRTLYSTGTFSYDSTTQINGSKSVKFTSAGSGGGYITSTSNFSVSPSVVYTVGFALKSSAADVRNVVEILWYKYDGTASTTATTTVYDESTANPTSWAEKWFEATSPSDAAFAKIRLTGCHSSDNTSGSTWYDAVVVTRYQVKKFNNVDPSLFSARLTLTTAVPVTTSDVTAAETIYLTPFNGNRISLYDGYVWVEYTLTEISADVPDANQMNDVFVYDNNGTLTLDITAWTNDTTRATALTTQNGVYVKSGSTSRRYVGSFYSTTAGNGQTEDSKTNRYLFNYYNKRMRNFTIVDTTNSWAYTTAAYRQANASSANQFNFVIGVKEEPVFAKAVSVAGNATADVDISTGIGLDSTSANSAQIIGFFSTPGGGAENNYPAYAEFNLPVDVGKHYLAWLEYSEALGTTTFLGDGNTTYIQSGLQGYIYA